MSMRLLNYTMLLRICMYKHTMYYTTLRIHKYIQKFLYTTDYISNVRQRLYTQHFPHLLTHNLLYFQEFTYIHTYIYIHIHQKEGISMQSFIIDN